MSFSIGQCATLACLLEVNAPKPGNVHRGADFEDATLNDFAASAVAIGEVLNKGPSIGLGEAILECVQSTQRVCSTNTNLGTILLLAPLAAVERDNDIRTGVVSILDSFSSSDAAQVYEAIRMANPGGLGEAETMDVSNSAPSSLIDAMHAAAARDLVAAEYVNGFAVTFDEVAPSILASRDEGLPLPKAIVHTQMKLLAAHGDSLIQRKCGDEMNRQCMARAQWVLDAGPPTDDNYHAALADLDFWLRSDGHRRNPGTTADLIAAGLFVGLRDGLIGPPFG